MADTKKTVNVDINMKVNRGFASSLNSDSKSGFAKAVDEKSTIDKANDVAKVSKLAMPGLIMDALLAVPSVFASLTKTLIWIAPMVLAALVADSVFDKFFKKDETTTEQMTNELSGIGSFESESENDDQFSGMDLGENIFADNLLKEEELLNNNQGSSSAMSEETTKSTHIVNLDLDDTNFTSKAADLGKNENFSNTFEGYNQSLNKSVADETTAIENLVSGPYVDLSDVLSKIIKQLEYIHNPGRGSSEPSQLTIDIASQYPAPVTNNPSGTITQGPTNIPVIIDNGKIQAVMSPQPYTKYP